MLSAADEMRDPDPAREHRHRAEDAGDLLPQERLNTQPKLCCPPGLVALNTPGFRIPPPGVAPDCCPRGQVCRSGGEALLREPQFRTGELRTLRERVRSRARSAKRGGLRSRHRPRHAPRKSGARRACSPSRRRRSSPIGAARGRRSSPSVPRSGRLALALLLPLAELTVAGLLLFPETAIYGAVGALVLLAIFSVAIGVQPRARPRARLPLLRPAALGAGELEDARPQRRARRAGRRLARRQRQSTTRRARSHGSVTSRAPSCSR